MTTEAESAAKRRLVRQRLAEAAAAARRGCVERRPPATVPPLSAEQQDVWLHAAMAPSVPLFNEAFTIHRHGPLDLPALEQSFNEVLRRTEIWRTSFDTIDGKLCQIVHPALQIKFDVADLTHLPAADRGEAARRLAETATRRLFDLGRLPLLRGTVLRLADDRHRLHVVLHHLIFDGVSIYRVVLPQLMALYAEFAGRRQPAPAEPALQYGDYAVWRERRLASDAMGRELEYWRRQLAGELPTLHLPTSRKPPAAPSYRGAMETFALSIAVTDRLKQLSRQEGVTLYVTLLAAFKALLHRYGGQDDIVIGGVTDMRCRPELERVVGYFLNSLALRTRPRSDLPFRDYLKQVQTTVVEALDASLVPFNRVVREVQRKRDAGRNALFQVLFSIQPPPPACDDGWDLTQTDVIAGAAKFDLYLELEERAEGGIVGRFIYSTDLFDAAAIRRMIGHWTTLLEAATTDPSRALGRLPLLTPREAQTLLVEWNATACEMPSLPLPAWIEAQARRTPDAIAVEFQGRRWRYDELERRARQLAARLRRAGAGRGDVVAVAVERSFEMVAALLAVLKTGAAYLPLDGALPPARLKLLIDDAGPAVVLSERALVDRMPRTSAPVVLCDEISPDEASDDGPPVPDEAELGSDDLAYVIYTSGSTGRPKGVEVRHGAVTNLLAAVQRELRFGARDRLLAVTTISFDIAALELFLPLVNGGRVVVASRDEATDPFKLAGLLQRAPCTVMQATPATWRGLLAAGWPGDPRLKILCGGEALPRDLARKLGACGAGLWNMYGPTETTIWSLMHKVGPEDDPVPIGRPLANTRVYVLDPNGHPVPAEVPGELHLGGAGLARGYRNDPEQTAARFRTVAAVPGERLYRTGDVVRYRADGVLEFLGRTDNQVKIRGFRVGLEEVDSALATHADVAAAAVRAVPDASGELSLIAFVVSKATPGRDIPGLPSFLQRTLPGYMVPSRIVAVDSLPMTANGKVDRKLLPDAPPALAAPPAAEPMDEIERSLVQVWEDLLGVPTVRVDDNFFALGGHSLLAFLLAAEIKRMTGRDLPLATLFQAPTIAQLAEVLRSAEEPEFSYLVPMRSNGPSINGNARPLFIVHGVFGNVLQMKGLAARLRTDRPVCAIQARGVDPHQEPHESIAEMADAYIEAIRTRQPGGPYAVAGYSFGGLVAYEIACRLRERGEQIDLLALIDVDLHERHLPMLDWLAYQWTLVLRVAHKLAILPVRQHPGYLMSKVRLICRQLLLRLGVGQPADPSNEITGALSPRAVRMYQIGLKEFISFKPRRYDGKINLLRVTGPRFDACDPLPIWRRSAAAVEVYNIVGPHESVMEETYVGTLAHQLNRCLAGLDPSNEVASASNRPDSLIIGDLAELRH